jgi:hypothetical protein
MTTIPQNKQLLNHLTELLQAHRHHFIQEWVFQHIALLVIAEIVVFARHTITQLLMGVGLTELDWSSWYRLFNHGRFPYEAASGVLFEETLAHVALDEVYVVAGDGTQTRRSSHKMEGALAFLVWVKKQLVAHACLVQWILMVADGHYAPLNLWKHLPERGILLARSAKKRVLCHLPGPNARKGDLAPRPLTKGDLRWIQPALRHAAFATARS